MSITASSLYRDTGNFARHQLATVLLMSLLAAFVTVMLVHVLTPGADQMAILQQGDDSASSLFEMGAEYVTGTATGTAARLSGQHFCRADGEYPAAWRYALSDPDGLFRPACQCAAGHWRVSSAAAKAATAHLPDDAGRATGLYGAGRARHTADDSAVAGSGNGDE